MKKICIGLEPEPDCIIENTEDTIDFFINTLLQRGTEYCIKQYGIDSKQTEKLIRHHIGVCFDTAHAAVQYENLAVSLRKLRDAQINICKVQLSSALCLKPSKSSLQQLKEFNDTVYLHQVNAKTGSGNIISYNDLSEALSATAEL